MRTAFLLESLKGKVHTEDLGVDGNDIKLGVIVWIGLMWVKLGIGVE
jgi:hypothetical protein